MEDFHEFTVDIIGTKCRSKREVYQVLGIEGGIFFLQLMTQLRTILEQY